MPITQVLEPAACVRTGKAGQEFITGKDFMSLLCQERQEGVSCSTRRQADRDFKTLDVLVSSPGPSLAEQIHAVPESVVNSSHCSVSSTGDLDLLTSDFMDLVNAIKTRKHRN